MILSIIIVNYNVKHFLEQCLYSVRKAIKDINAEVIVIDNNSTDDSRDYITDLFPEVIFIKNEVNTGFAKACNIGVNHSTGEYILFLNPDTIVAEDSFTKTIDFFKKEKDCGAVGVKMIDGSGEFLKESKRSFPSPRTSLYKLFGLAQLFPKSPTFSRYHLGHLDAESNHEVDVLAGAYLMVKKSVLEKIGSFDESFFMYGEDVDLSYRIQKEGFKNYYCSETTIIHFKGESTKRGSLNYVRLFYNAMSIFVRKHYGGTRAGFFNASIQVAIWLRAFFAASARFITWIGLPFIDAILILLSFWLVKEVWVSYIRTDVVFPNTLLLISFPLYTLIYLSVAYFAGLYDRYFKTANLIRSTLIATIALLVLYALLPEKFRFSRAVVVFGALLALAFIIIQRWILAKAQIIKAPVVSSSKPYILIASSTDEFEEIKSFLSKAGLENKIIGRISINGESHNFVARLNHLNEAAKVLDAREIILCAGKLSYKEIIEQVQKLNGSLRCRFHAFKSNSIVGSDTSTESGEAVTIESDYKISISTNKRLKRLIDFSFSIFFFVTFPLHFIFVKNCFHFFKNCFDVLTGKKTWVGYAFYHAMLPPVRPSVLSSSGRKNISQNIKPEQIQQLDYWYARNYEPKDDIKIILKNYKFLGS